MILLGIVILALGICAVVFAQNVWNFTGGIDFIEDHFPGNTKAFIQLTGVVMVLLGILFITGLGGWLTGPISETAGKIFGGYK